MKIAVWVIFGALALMWTAGTFITVKLTQWGVDLLATGNFEQWSRDVAQWPVPEGLSFWLDPSVILGLQQMTLISLEAFRNALPYMTTMMGWLVPMLWVVWGFGLLGLLALAGGAHWLASRYVPARPVAA